MDDVSWSVLPGETLALVGEAGCGKSVSALAVMRLLSKPPGPIAGGVWYFSTETCLTTLEARCARPRPLHCDDLPGDDDEPQLGTPRSVVERLSGFCRATEASTFRECMDRLQPIAFRDQAAFSAQAWLDNAEKSQVVRALGLLPN